MRQGGGRLQGACSAAAGARARAAVFMVEAGGLGGVGGGERALGVPQVDAKANIVLTKWNYESKRQI